MTTIQERLAEALEFDHVIQVLPGRNAWFNPTRGEYLDPVSVPYAPDAIDPDSMAIELDGWQLPFSGWSGQYGYSGPWFHDSEVMSDSMADYVLDHPGYWVAIYAQYNAYEPEDVNYDDGEYDIEGWTLAYKEVM